MIFCKNKHSFLVECIDIILRHLSQDISVLVEPKILKTNQFRTPEFSRIIDQMMALTLLKLNAPTVSLCLAGFPDFRALCSEFSVVSRKEF